MPLLAFLDARLLQQALHLLVITLWALLLCQFCYQPPYCPVGILPLWVLQALKMLADMKANPGLGSTYTDVDQMMEELLADV